MKGIAHFLTGVALATCFPEVVALARAGSLLPVLGGVGGLLPDLLDFRFVRFWTRYDVEIDPGSEGGNAAAEAIVAQFVQTMDDAYESRELRRVVVHTVRLGADLWRRYTIRIDPDQSTVAVRVGPVVDTGQQRVPSSEPPDTAWAVRKLAFPMVHAYRRIYHIDIFTGPSFKFVREGDRLAISFLDWHHRWTHSLPLALAVGLCAGLFCGVIWGLPAVWLCGGVTALGFAAHVLEDQLGHMGCNLFWPVTRARTPGLGLLHAADAWPNFLTVWSSLSVILLNLDRLGGPGLLPVGPYLALVVAGPWAVALAVRLWRRGRSASTMAPVGVGPSADVVGGTRALAESERLAEVLDRDAA
ncbi:MAG: metal-dependent hydrolase [Anaerolineae bacterium]|nr:metal-dependent hydrolase [Anaerolineae bacterium]